MTALMPIRKGPYEQEKYEEQTLIGRQKAGKNPISQRDFRKDPSSALLWIRKYFFLIRNPDPQICIPDLQINCRFGWIRILPGHVMSNR
jgi:hypothetical protein